MPDACTLIYYFIISVYNAEHSKHIPSGHEAIFVTVGGRSADLSGGGRYPVYMTVKKGLKSGYNMSTAISDIAVISGKASTIQKFHA